MYGLIWLIIIGIVIYKSVRKKEEQGGRQQPPNPYDQNGNGNVPPRFSGQASHSLMKAGNQRQAASQANVAGQKSGQQAMKTQPDSSGSTMAYLEEKARQDAREHAREKWEENKRLRENSGGRLAAERLYDGDPVPKGKKCVACGYCGAQNLLPATPRERYSCYFCREPLN